MNEEQKNPQLNSQQVFHALINDLLKPSETDEELDIEIDGYPADYLDAPNPSRVSLKKYKLIECHGANIDFDVFSLCDGDVACGIVFNSKAQMMLLNFGVKKAYITTKKLRSLLYDNAGKGRIKSHGSKEWFVIQLPTKLLLDNSEVL